ANVLVSCEVFGIFASCEATTHRKWCEPFSDKEASLFVLVVLDHPRCPITQSAVHALHPQVSWFHRMRVSRKNRRICHRDPSFREQLSRGWPIAVNRNIERFSKER